MTRTILSILFLLGVGAALGFGLTRFVDSDTEMAASEEDKEILYWVAPMDPDYRSDKPGQSPMGMDLEPVYEGEDPGENGDVPSLRINPAMVNNLGVRTASVKEGTLHRPINTVGFVVPNDDLFSHVHVRTEGWIEELVVKTAGEAVAADDLLFRMYAPALVNAQEDYLQAQRLDNPALAGAARARLAALGMAGPQIETLAKTREIRQQIDVRAPRDGTVLNLGVAEGMYIQPQDTIMNIADLSSVWVMVEVFEDQIAWVEEGQTATMQLAAAPGRTWEGTVDYVYPTVDPKSRTVRVRLVFDNPNRVLKPDMYADITLEAAPKTGVIHIPRSALIQTENSERVILALGDGRFRPAQVVAGVESGDRIEVIDGLKPGEQVVTSGQFLIDSEANLDASLRRLTTEETEGDEGRADDKSSASKEPISGAGRVREIDAAKNRVTLAHDPMPEIGWPAMTMGFSAKTEITETLSVGDQVTFDLMEMPDGNYVITNIDKISADDGADGAR